MPTRSEHDSLITCLVHRAQFVKKETDRLFLASHFRVWNRRDESYGGLSFATFGNGRELGSSTATTLRELAAAMDSTKGGVPELTNAPHLLFTGDSRLYHHMR